MDKWIPRFGACFFIKTSTERYPEVEALIRKIHPYECPEIICLPIIAGLPDYLAWLQRECQAGVVR
ncbi:MAG TPA: hypothetical protein DCS43_07395 [Verrucomicrobia bacterium]|nr:hypothetical protein [Verrucomicrobiota bacterium]